MMGPQFISGFGASHSEKNRPYTTIDLAGIRALVDAPAGVDKLQAQWFIPSTLLTRTFREQEAHGEFWMLWADLDQEPLPLESVAELIRSLGCDYEIYTSRSATVDVPKCRILIPLSKPLSGKRWVICQEIFNDLLVAGGAIPDRANERCGQLCFLPNRGEHYETFVRRDEVFFDPLTAWAPEIQVKEDKLKKQEEEVQARRVVALERKASLGLGREPTLIEAFNASYPVEEILLRAGYDQRGNRFRHPNSESGSFSASVQDGRVHSLSTADPLYTNGQGAHDAFSAFTVLFADGGSSRALKQAGDQMVMIGNESWNAVKQREYAIAHAPEPVDISGLLLNLRAQPEDPPPDTPQASDEPVPSEPIALPPPSFILDRFVLNGQSAQMEAQMLDDKFVLDGLAIYGQITVIYAPPNAGKTLITLQLIIEAIRKGEIQGFDVYYINADDNYKGLVTKLKLAEKNGFQLIAPYLNDFKLDEFTNNLSKSVADNTARGKVVMLDTVKKFTDIMNKSTVSDFSQVLRAFAQAGGTVILLAHVNKHRDLDKKVVAAGTSDLMDDADCVYTLDTANQGHGYYLATFENKKSRGDVKMSVTYRYMRYPDQSYEELLGSVRLVTHKEIEESQRAAEIEQSRQANRELLTVLVDIMNEGMTIKGEIVKEAVKRAEVSKDTVNQVLRTHTGEYYLSGHYWTMVVGEKNAKLFTLLKEYQKPYKPAPKDKPSDAVRGVTLTASTASTANSIRTGLTDDDNVSQAAASTANSMPPPIMNDVDEWRARP